jgi:hypothetical protein
MAPSDDDLDANSLTPQLAKKMSAAAIISSSGLFLYDFRAQTAQKCSKNRLNKPFRAILSSF